MTENDDTEFKTLISLLLQLTEAQHGLPLQPGQTRLNDIQCLYVKLLQHLVTLDMISNGITIRTNDATFVYIDHSSQKIITRAAVETYIVTYYISHAVDDEVLAFRHMAWRLEGLIDRKKLPALTESIQDKKASEKVLINTLIADIKSSKYFSQCSKKLQDRLLNGGWRGLSSWSELAESAGFNKKHFKGIYNYLCGYSHSSYASVLQISQLKELQDQKSFSDTIITFAKFLVAHAINAYADIFQSSQSVFKNNKDAYSLAQQWHIMSNMFDNIYDAHENDK